MRLLNRHMKNVISMMMVKQITADTETRDVEATIPDWNKSGDITKYCQKDGIDGTLIYLRFRKLMKFGVGLIINT